MARSLALFLASLLAGCASTLPESISKAPPGDPSIAAVRAAPERHEGVSVRWGGIIADVRNRAESTQVEVIGYELTDKGRPAGDKPAGGRFIAQFPGFVEPTAYEKGRSLTVVGTVRGQVERKIDEYPYSYPLVAVEQHYLWEPTPRYESQPHTVDPWWPYAPRPYYGPYSYPYAPYPYWWRHPYFW